MSTNLIRLPVFRFLDTQLQNYKLERERLKTELELHEIEISQVCPDIEEGLLSLIPNNKENKDLLSILKTIMPGENGNKEQVSFLRKLIDSCFNKDELVFQEEFTWQRPKVMIPFIDDFDRLVSTLKLLDNLWQDQARITVSSDGIYYSFTFQRL